METTQSPHQSQSIVYIVIVMLCWPLFVVKELETGRFESLRAKSPVHHQFQVKSRHHW